MIQILILLPYYERPLLVRNALNSIRKQKYANWHLAFIDDCSTIPGRPIVEEILSDSLDKVSFYNTETPKEKKGADSSLIGYFCNIAIQTSNANVVTFLCDDDELHPDYFQKLATFFQLHPRCISAYSHIYPYNPAFEIAENVTYSPEELSKVPYNRWTIPVRASGRLDASQVAWSMDVHKKHDIWFHYPKTRNLDYDIYIQIYQRFGKKLGRSDFTQAISQYKSVTPVCLFSRDNSIQDFDLHGLEKATSIEEIEKIARRYAKNNPSEALRIINKGLEINPDAPNLLLAKNGFSSKNFSVIIATYGAKDLVETTIRSLLRVGQNHIHKLYVMDSSHLEKAAIYKETAQRIQELQKEFPVIEYVAFNRHNHGKKLDAAMSRVETPYTLISDSDVDYYADLFTSARQNFESNDKLFMIGNKQKGKELKIRSIEAPRLEPYCLFVRTEIAQRYLNAGYSFYRNSAVQQTEQGRVKIFYDTASHLWHTATKKGLEWLPIDTTAYHHIQHGSWYQNYVNRSGLITQTV